MACLLSLFGRTRGYRRTAAAAPAAGDQILYTAGGYILAAPGVYVDHLGVIDLEQKYNS